MNGWIETHSDVLSLSLRRPPDWEAVFSPAENSLTIKPTASKSGSAIKLPLPAYLLT